MSYAGQFLLRHCRIAAMLVAGPCMPVAAQAFPEPFAVTYAMTARGVTFGETVLELSSANGGRFVFESRSTPVGLFALVRDERIVERSEWRMNDANLRPLHYRYRRWGGKKEREIEVVFDWERQVARNTAKGSSWDMSFPVGTLDKLNHSVALMRDLAAGKRTISYTVADGGKLKRYEFELLGAEQIDTPLGAMETLKVRRVRRESKRETVFWCATALRFLPVRIEHKERDGTVITWQARVVEGLDAADSPRPSRAQETH